MVINCDDFSISQLITGVLISPDPHHILARDGHKLCALLAAGGCVSTTKPHFLRSCRLSEKQEEDLV